MAYLQEKDHKNECYRYKSRMLEPRKFKFFFSNVTEIKSTHPEQLPAENIEEINARRQRIRGNKIGERIEELSDHLQCDARRHDQLTVAAAKCKQAE